MSLLTKLYLTFILLALTGCASTGQALDDTVAAGQPGKVDYCVTFMGNNLICVNAERRQYRKADPGD